MSDEGCEERSARRERLERTCTVELVSLALRGEADSSETWEVIAVLQRRGGREVLEAAQVLLASPAARVRCLAADILGQLGAPGCSQPRACGDLLIRRLRIEREPVVVNHLSAALGHLREPRAISLLLGLKAHPCPDVRFGAVLALFNHGSEEAVRALIEISADEDRDLRSWATLALGDLCEGDSAELREALLERIDDADAEVRGQALLGLAVRKDPRVLEPLRCALQADDVDVLTVEAAAAMGDASLQPLLLRLRDVPQYEEPFFETVLEDALAAFAPPHH